MNKEEIKLILYAAAIFDIIFILIFFAGASSKAASQATELEEKNNMVAAADDTLSELTDAESGAEDLSSETGEVPDQIKDDSEKTHEQIKAEAFLTMLEGHNFYYSDSVKFFFGYNGSFSGFFDGTENNVVGYWYEITNGEDEKCILTIYKTDRSAHVSYVLGFNSKSEITLYHQTADITLTLKPL